MKKFIFTILIIFFMLSLTACNKTKVEVNISDTSTEKPTETISTEAPTEAETASPLNNPFKDVMENKIPAEIFEPAEISLPKSYTVKDHSPNTTDDIAINLFKLNNKSIDLSSLTIDNLSGYQITPAEGENLYFKDSTLFFDGQPYTTNGDKKANIYLQVSSNSTTIDAISVTKDNTSITFFNGLKCGMSLNEATPLLKGFNLKEIIHSETSSTYIFLLKNNNYSLIVNIEEHLITNITLINNTSIQNWETRT